MRRADAMTGARTVSLNRRIKEHVLSRIRAGSWAEGARIPSEADLCAEFGASRMTVNRALRELTEQGFLTRTQGAGTFVARGRLDATMVEIRSIRREIAARGGTHRARVLTLQNFTPGPSEAAGIGLDPGRPAILFEALHSDGDRPVQLERRVVDPALAPGFAGQDFTDRAASDWLLEMVPYTRAHHTVSAVAADARVASLLDIAPGAPCLRLVRRTWADGRLITHADLIHPGAEFTLSGSVPVPGAAP